MAYSPIDKGSLFFNNVTYTGTGASNAVTGVGFAPDFVWCKDRVQDINSSLCDTVRAATKTLISNTNDDEQTYAEGLKSFDADGFTVGTQGFINTNTNGYISYNWKAGTTTGLTGGTITPSSYSINTTSGIGIYKYTGNGTAGATIAHGLGKAPKLVIIKRLSASYQWAVWGSGVNNTKGLRLDDTAAETTNDFLNNTAPDATNVTLGSNTYSNAAAGTSVYVMYAFVEVPGFCKIGKYSGTGMSGAGTNSSAATVYCGFKPKFVMMKRIDSTSNWNIYDDKREFNYNTQSKAYRANTSEVEYTIATGLDLFSNGFRTRTTNTQFNAEGGVYLYLAFGQTMVGSNDVVGTAR